MAIRWPKLGKNKPGAKAPAPGGQGQTSSAARMPFIGALSVGGQLSVFAAVLAVMGAIAGYVAYTDNRVATYGTIYISGAGDLRMLSQRIGKATQTALQGNAPAFRELLDARERFTRSLTLLADGGRAVGMTVPPTSEAVRPALRQVQEDWGKAERDLQLVQGQQKNLVGLATAVRSMSSSNPTLVELAEQLQTARVAANAPAKEVSMLGQLVALSLRLGRGANALLGADTIDTDIGAAMTEDSRQFGTLLLLITESAQATSPEAAPRELLTKLDAAYKEFHAALGGILDNAKALADAKVAGKRVVQESEGLLAGTERLLAGYQEELAGRATSFLVLGMLALLAILVVWLMVKVYVDDQRRQAQEALRQTRANEEAILQLMDEMQNLADGDLTVNATVTEAVTGALADAVNLTIEELRGLVGKITDAEAMVTAATESAQETSRELLVATEKQAVQIREAGTSMLGMAREMTGMSASTAQSAGVARTSLAAAQKGQVAVQNSIAGMNEIRENIQETSKRIKRLAESSQEIGEIVELISGITEQTNVLALNAAIQAASAGEAGRGFTVVAEEVQRLAERSAKATQQIAGIVKTIQSDTQETAVAMEKSTQGVVEGTRLSQGAGQALAEISEVSQRLAQLIESISAAAQKQAGNAAGMAQAMQEILKVTQHTTEGTEQTAMSVGALAAMGRELKASVSRFKVERDEEATRRL
jgi:twitching motility protein PilJ